MIKLLETLYLVLPFVLMVVEIMAAEFIFGIFLERRSFFWVRFIGAMVVCIFATVWIEIGYSLVMHTDMVYEMNDGVGDSLFKMAYFLFIFILTVCACMFSYKASAWMVLFYCSGGYAAQHISVNAAALFKVIPPVSALLSQAPYLSYVFEILFCAAVYALLYFLCLRKRESEASVKGIRKKVLLSFGVIIICIGLSRITKDDPSRGTVAYIAESISAIINCVLVLVILFGIADKDKADTEVAIMTELLHREKEQYRLTKENIDLINIKCHDLKHQINALRENASETSIKEIEEAIMFYDAAVKTGNDVLDVILTEKTLLCERNKISFTCVARGEELAFMDNMDIYSLFGNALSNAIENVRGIEDEERRCITVNIGTVGNMLSVHVCNFYEGEIKFENGLPSTSKDGDYHGFGVKSMDFIAKKYNGSMSISTNDGIFSLDFLFPLALKTAEN